MNRTQTNIGKALDRLLSRYDNPSPERMQSAIGRVGESLRSKIGVSSIPRLSSFDSVPSVRRFRKLSWMAAAAAIVIAVGLSAAGVHLWISRDVGALASVQTVDGALYMDDRPIGVSDRVAVNEILRTNDKARAQLILSDGSRVEMRAQSELLFERANDGVRIRLNRGGIIVSAAKQGRRHLYVQTREITVSVVGTVFMVNAETEGSRVAVIQGEVRVQQGAMSTKLLPGEQVSTNPLMESQPLSEEIAWSQSAPAHMALLQQSTVVPIEEPTIRPLEFAVASIKAYPPDTVHPDLKSGIACRGTDGVQEVAFSLQLTMDPVVVAPQGRCVAVRVLLPNLIRFAYGIKDVSGGPDWVSRPGSVLNTPAGVVYDSKSMFHIEAAADDLSTATTEQLKQMLQTMLADRFKLKSHKEMRESPGYALVIAESRPKLKAVANSPELPIRLYNDKGQEIIKGRSTLDKLIQILYIGAPTVDKTGLAGVYEYELVIPDLVGGGQYRATGLPQPITPPAWSSILEAQLGLRLQSEKAVPTQRLVIDHVEPPSPN